MEIRVKWLELKVQSKFSSFLVVSHGQRFMTCVIYFYHWLRKFMDIIDAENLQSVNALCIVQRVEWLMMLMALSNESDMKWSSDSISLVCHWVYRCNDWDILTTHQRQVWHNIMLMHRETHFRNHLYNCFISKNTNIVVNRHKAKSSVKTSAANFYNKIQSMAQRNVESTGSYSVWSSRDLENQILTFA